MYIEPAECIEWSAQCVIRVMRISVYCVQHMQRVECVVEQQRSYARAQRGDVQTHSMTGAGAGGTGRSLACASHALARALAHHSGYACIFVAVHLR